jgi:hypothetical protein
MRHNAPMATRAERHVEDRLALAGSSLSVVIARCHRPQPARCNEVMLGFGSAFWDLARGAAVVVMGGSSG